MSIGSPVRSGIESWPCRMCDRLWDRDYASLSSPQGRIPRDPRPVSNLGRNTGRSRCSALPRGVSRSFATASALVLGLALGFTGGAATGCHSSSGHALHRAKSPTRVCATVAADAQPQEARGQGGTTAGDSLDLRRDARDAGIPAQAIRVLIGTLALIEGTERVPLAGHPLVFGCQYYARGPDGSLWERLYCLGRDISSPEGRYALTIPPSPRGGGPNRIIVQVFPKSLLNRPHAPVGVLGPDAGECVPSEPEAGVTRMHWARQVGWPDPVAGVGGGSFPVPAPVEFWLRISAGPEASGRSGTLVQPGFAGSGKRLMCSWHLDTVAAEKRE